MKNRIPSAQSHQSEASSNVANSSGKGTSVSPSQTTNSSSQNLQETQPEPINILQKEVTNFYVIF